MHSASTDRPASPPDSTTIPTHPAPTGVRQPVWRLPSVLFVLLVTAVLLSGCASDHATDQSRARRTAEVNQGGIAHDQATFNAARYASPGATPTTIPVLPGVVHELGIAISVQGNNQPSSFVTSIPVSAGTIYVAADVEQIPAGSTVTATMFKNTTKPADRTEAAQASVTISTDGRQWIAVPLFIDSSLEPGQYGIELVVGNDLSKLRGSELGSLGIELTGPGTQPRSV